jgi:hypothetical protein
LWRFLNHACFSACALKSEIMHHEAHAGKFILPLFFSNGFANPHPFPLPDGEGVRLICEMGFTCFSSRFSKYQVLLRFDCFNSCEKRISGYTYYVLFQTVSVYECCVCPVPMDMPPFCLHVFYLIPAHAGIGLLAD